MQRKIRRFLSLPQSEKLLFFEALTIISKYQILLKFKGFNNTRHSIFTNHNTQEHDQSTAFFPSLLATRICRAIDRGARIIPGTSCLIRAFAAADMLKKRGYNTRLHIGINRKVPDTVEIHAWLSMDGEIVMGKLPELADFQEFPLNQM